MTFIAYLDEFGHIGPYISKDHEKYKESPVFGLAGYIIPIEEVRAFGTWFFQRKCELLQWELERSGKHPAIWEKKGSSLYTKRNVAQYQQLRRLTNRLLSRISASGGSLFYVGLQKMPTVKNHDPNRLYETVLKECIKRLDEFCENDCQPADQFLLALDEHDQRDNLITASSIAMYGGAAPRRRLLEPPFQLESHRYQTLQVADWIAGLIGRLGAYWASPEEYAENEIFSKYFGARVTSHQVRSGIRTRTLQPVD
ncbi:hypothetical protein PSE_0954 [Pseudovibrio sp. FO-BEG1]|uniref:DUF3800 domain-containing protein n=1 Tax=Pseudovibrio sp. (strain FO-BEG1) TaxID=911045 RepID=UPI000238C551|nr:DUF3800 domain-containing protein [Pseudovibrio sp. FO-BEG1]AEV35466.1 hypothetical protein PSE_0954 [Pseudovibrio sp. FO-BEG1]